MIYTKYLLSAAAFALAAPSAMLVPAAPAQAQAQARTQARGDQLDQVVGALRAISTMQADFTQTDRNGSTVGGSLTLKRPGRIRFQYSRDVNMLVVSDGRALTLIDYDVRQVQRYPISNSPLGALLDPNRDVRRYGRLVPTGNPNVISVAVRDPGKPEYGTITLVFTRNAAAPGGLELTSWVALDAQNTRTTVRLSNQRYGMAVPDRTFTYTDPRRTTNRR
ncbi:cell envelope biogenesis protein LolA [Croceibacterium mercuriale]|uniref:Cell envelope biogenesis protein LolA n=1 Tax=Croceibacterium mercuriale TaxID=1572751 RepID=A0A0B2BUE3_9SPHN|nr:outer membrane lipoprotein carrier protein LolA [Croceibacterium mercuriale]KHL25168.1 cell envelope biogenesis protein LolA [Croceibacterium mercuriale]